MDEPFDIRAAAIAAIAALVLTGCAGGPTLPVNGTTDAAGGSAAAPDPALGNRISDIARAMVGAPYAYGGADPSGFDCSGLVYYAYKRSGIDVPRTSLDLYRQARKIPLDDAAPGDLVFFQDEARLSHVGIYVGGDRFVHAPASGREVGIANLAHPYYRMHLVGVGRIADL